MSDITIPGVNSGLNTDKIVSKLMELERIPLNRKEDELKEFENEKVIWQDLTKIISKLQDTAKKLYGAENPFGERVAESSDEDILTATANRSAIEEEKKIKVLKTASADRFLSDSLSEDFDAPAGSYEFEVGDKEVSFNFRGGSLSRLAKRINSRAGDLLRAQVIKDTSDTNVILIESQKQGAENKLIFKEGTSLDFAVSAGIIKQSDSSLRPVAFDSETISPGAEGSIPLSPPAEDNGQLIVEISLKVNDLEQQKWVPPTPPPGPDSPSPGSLSFSGIEIRNNDSLVDLPVWRQPQPPEKVEDMEVFFAEGGGRRRGFPALKNTESEQKISIPLSDLGGRLDSIEFTNRNTYKEISISDIKVFDPNARGEWKAARAISEASDSKIEIDGIEITRNSNAIDDLIPGVTLNLKESSDDTVTLKIEPDREMIKDTIINFIGSYNRLQANLGILTSNDGAIISELDYFTEDETKTARERLGHFQGDSTLIQMKTRFQRIMMNPYTTESDVDLRMLSQIGISTNSTGFGGGVNNAKLRGYIEINEDKLDQALDTNIQAVKELFGRDTDGDLIVDTGAAFKTQEYSQPYTGTNGIISYRISSLDSRITRTERDISNYELKLADKEAELKNKYAIMEGNLNSMRQSSNALNNLNNNNN